MSWRKPKVAKTVDQKYLPKARAKKVQAVTTKPDLTPKPVPIPVREPKPVPKKTTVVEPKEVVTKESKEKSKEKLRDARGTHPNSKANLELGKFPPGVSGNPEGKKPGTVSYKTVAERVHAKMAVKLANEFNRKNKKRIEEKKERKRTPEDYPIIELIVEKHTTLAIQGREKPLDSVQDRYFGKATQTHKNADPEDDPLVAAQIRAAEAQVDAWEHLWEEEGVLTGSRKHD